MRHPVLTAIAVFLLAGCVKEERTGCPCYLTLNLDEVIADREFSEAVATLTPCVNGNTGRDLLALHEYEKVGYEKKVRKDLVNISVICGHRNGVFEDDCILFAENTQSDPIMAYAESKLCDAETAEADVRLHKQYCRMQFKPEGLEEGEEYPYRLRVRAECNGLKLYDLMPVEGVFSAEAVSGIVGEMSVDIPRQKRNSMKLDIVGPAGDVVHTVNLGAALSNAGYDWRKEDLDDVIVRIDYAKAEFEIGIIPWETYYETVDI